MSTLTKLFNLAGRAVDVCDAQFAREQAKRALHKAYRNWKFANEIGRVERDTDDWGRMMADTKPAYERYELAKQKERNALRRLATAVRRFKAQGEE